MKKYKQAMDYLEQLDEAIKKAEEALSKQAKVCPKFPVYGPEHIVSGRENTRKKAFTQRAVVRRAACRAGRLTIKESDLRFDVEKRDRITKACDHAISAAMPCNNIKGIPDCNCLQLEPDEVKNESSPNSIRSSGSSDVLPTEANPLLTPDEPGGIEQHNGSANWTLGRSIYPRYQAARDNSIYARPYKLADSKDQNAALHCNSKTGPKNSVLKSIDGPMSCNMLESISVFQDSQQAAKSAEDLPARDGTGALLEEADGKPTARILVQTMEARRIEETMASGDPKSELIAKQLHAEETEDVECTCDSAYPSFAGPYTKKLQPLRFHCTTVSNDGSQLGFDRRTLTSKCVPIQVYSFQACILQDKVLSKKEGKEAGAKRIKSITSRCFRTSLHRKIKDFENTRSRGRQQKALKALELVLNASKERQIAIEEARDNLSRPEINKTILKILQIDKALNKNIRDALEPGAPEIKDRLDVLIDDVRRDITELRADRENNVLSDAEPNEFKCEDESAHSHYFSPKEHLDSEQIMEFERTIVRCLISLSKEEINETIRKYSMFSQSTSGIKEAEAVLNDRVFRNYLGLQIAKSIHSNEIKAVMEKLNEYRNFTGAVIEIINRGRLDMDERFAGMITRSADKLQNSNDPFTCKMAVQLMLCRKYVKDSVELKKLLTKFSSLDV